MEGAEQPSKHLRLAALARLISDSVLQRASDAGVELRPVEVVAVINIAAQLARVAYGEAVKIDPWAAIKGEANLIYEILENE